MSKYVIKFAKKGYFCYTSHLDLMRFFQRAFKRGGISLKYSQGFNPHPKMGFAQPLSLGYESDCELMEFETKEQWETEILEKKMKEAVGDCIEILGCKELSDKIKSLASLVKEAEYTISFPIPKGEKDRFQKISDDFFSQEGIITEKRQKKTKALKEINIKPMIKQVKTKAADRVFLMTVRLDAGSVSNLNPELLIKAFLEYGKIPIAGEEITVKRNKLIFVNKYQF